MINKLEEGGVEVAALDHLLHETPRIMFIHFVGTGNEVEMAKAILGRTGAHQVSAGVVRVEAGDKA